MPATYLSFEIEPGMTIEQKQEKLYLGVISAGEQAYTLGAAIAECRKGLAAAEDRLREIDALVDKMRIDYSTLKAEVRASVSAPEEGK
jgi:hypothetical protein